jgi:hypothetical protein
LTRLARAAVVAVLALSVPASAASAATTRVVDDDHAQCPNAAFTSIQAAVNAAAAGDTIAICAGTYRETAGPGDPNAVRIDKPLTVRGAGANLVRIEPSGSITDPTPAIRDDEGNVIVVDQPGGDVDIEGVTVAAGDASHPRTADAGVLFQNASGSVTRSRLTDLAPADLADYSTGVGQGVVAFSTGTSPGFHVDVSSTLIDGHAKGGVLIDAPAGAPLAASVTDSVIRGRGPRSEAGQGQNGIQVSGPGARATIERNAIVDHRFLGDESASVGVLLFDADAADTQIHDNDFRGNGYGVFNADSSGCDSATPVAAGSNWWGNPLGPTVDTTSGPPGACGPYGPTGDPALGDRVNGAAVAFATPRAQPRGTPAAPAAQPDARPTLAIDSPADGAVADPGSAVTVNATAGDDFDVKRVEFRRGATLVATDASPPYSAEVTAPAAGESTAVTVTAFDSADQTAAAAISLRGRPAPVTPQQPAEPEDRPPTVAITGPAPGSQIDPLAAPRLTADASDDRGVARVVFLDDGQPVCTDDTAPYDCAYTPNGGDVGRDTLIAIAVDGAGQTAVDFRGVEVRRFNPQLTARTTPGRDRKRPYRYTTTGSVLLPAGVTPAQACAVGGSIAIEFRVGKLRLPMNATLRPDCTFQTSIAFPSRRPLGNGRIAVSSKFGGNAVLGTAKARTQKVRAG